MPRKVRRASPLGGASRGLASSIHVSGGSRSTVGSVARSRPAWSPTRRRRCPRRRRRRRVRVALRPPRSPSHTPSRRRCTPDAEPTQTVPSRPRTIDRTDCSPSAAAARGAGALEEIVARPEPQPPRRHLERRDRRHRHAIRGADGAQGGSGLRRSRHRPAPRSSRRRRDRSRRAAAASANDQAGRDVLEVHAVEAFEMAALRLGFRRQHPRAASPGLVEDLDRQPRGWTSGANVPRSRSKNIAGVGRPPSRIRPSGISAIASVGPGRLHARAAGGTPASAPRGGAAARCRAG